jgi:hypothetical protein
MLLHVHIRRDMLSISIHKSSFLLHLFNFTIAHPSTLTTTSRPLYTPRLSTSLQHRSTRKRTLAETKTSKKKQSGNFNPVAKITQSPRQSGSPNPKSCLTHDQTLISQTLFLPRKNIPANCCLQLPPSLSHTHTPHQITSTASQSITGHYNGGKTSKQKHRKLTFEILTPSSTHHENWVRCTNTVPFPRAPNSQRPEVRTIACSFASNRPRHGGGLAQWKRQRGRARAGEMSTAAPEIQILWQVRGALVFKQFGCALPCNKPIKSDPPGRPPAH